MRLLALRLILPPKFLRGLCLFGQRRLPISSMEQKHKLSACFGAMPKLACAARTHNLSLHFCHYGDQIFSGRIANTLMEENVLSLGGKGSHMRTDAD